MSDEAKRVLADVDAIAERARRGDHITAARVRAIAAGGDPERAGREAAFEYDGPYLHPVTARREQVLDAALRAGRITPAERPRFAKAMEVDEQGVVAAIERLPTGRLPLEPKAVVPDPENPGGQLGDDGLLAPGWSLLTASQRAELAARRRRERGE